MTRRLAWAVCALGMSACRTAAGPQEVGEAYVRALRDDRLDDAYALLSAEARRRVALEAFRKRYADAVARNERATEIEAALPRLEARAPALDVGLVRETEGWRVEDAAPDAAGPGVALEKFLGAVDRGDFAAACELLAEPLRARYTPQRLQEDLEREPLAKERLARARRALSGPPVMRAGGAEYLIGDGKAVRLVREGRAYKVAALE